MSEDLQLLTSTPLGPFKTTDDALAYFEDIMQSGVSLQTREMIYILGRNGIGKTSLLRTLKKFAESPTKHVPTMILSENHSEFLKTQLAEVHKDVKLDKTIHGGKIQIMRDEDFHEDGDIKLVNFDKDAQEEDVGICHTNVIDFGGQAVYLACAPFLLQKQEFLLVCFDSSRVRNLEDVETKYFGEIGRFLDLICEQERTNLKIYTTKLISLITFFKRFSYFEPVTSDPSDPGGVS